MRESALSVQARSITIRFAAQGMEWVAASIAELLPARPKLFLISDAAVALLYEKPLREALTSLGFTVASATFEPGELHKHLRTAAALLNPLAERQFARDDVIIGFGGGVSTDIAGFVASLYARGMRWIAVPTTILGMADAAIGGKTGVDHPLGKNLIGTFHHPLAVLAPLSTLETLPARQWKAGSAEVVKSGLLDGGELWQLVEANGPDLYRWPRATASDAVTRAARVKVGIVSQDERERDLRRLLNLGHTFGHALETATGYRSYLHGEAIFLGLRAAVGLSHAEGFLDADDSTRIDDVLAQVPLPRASVTTDALLSALAHDKKFQARQLHWVLLKALGQPFITSDVSQTNIEKVADWLCQLTCAGEQVELRRAPRILVLNGPNLNLLGEREPDMYGYSSYAELEGMLHRWADERDIELLVRQSNHEGELISLIQQARHWADGIVINPASYSHTSVGIRDALSAVTLPAIEVHLTDISKREEFRRASLTAPACVTVISGKGPAGYLEALEQLTTLIEQKQTKEKV